MALKPDRHELDTRIDYFMNETATRGADLAVCRGAGLVPKLRAR